MTYFVIGDTIFQTKQITVPKLTEKARTQERIKNMKEWKQEDFDFYCNNFLELPQIIDLLPLESELLTDYSNLLPERRRQLYELFRKELEQLGD